MQATDTAINLEEAEPALDTRRPVLLRLALFIPEFLCAVVLGLLVLFLVIAVISRYEIGRAHV